MNEPLSRPLRVGVLGTSWWADSMYLPALDGHPDVEISGVCGRREAPARDLAATWNIDWVSTDVDEFLDPERLDAVIVATSNDSHEPITVTAFDRGLHVLCEKPVATTTAALLGLTDVPPLIRAFSKAHANSVGRYQSVLTWQQIRRVAEAAGELLNALGYPTSR